jgi:TNF receptor-associated protein 1
MNRRELISNLGTIARSGSKAFLESVQKSKDMKAESNNIIGKFGVGFYSSFMVAEAVEVFSRHADEEKGYYWWSDGLGEFEIAEAEVPHRGTKIVLHLKEECANFAKQVRFSCPFSFCFKLDSSFFLVKLTQQTPSMTSSE